MNSDSSTVSAKGLQLWPVFICYRQADGLAAARRLHELLDKQKVEGPNGEHIQLDVYLDQTMPAVADWREIHRPYLERARALVLVCSPGAKIVEGEDDWVHKEIRWWLDHRPSVPILIDPLRQGTRYVPTAISERWPNLDQIQRIPLVEEEWANLGEAATAQKADALRRQIVGNILPSGATIYAAELEEERQRAQRLSLALKGRTRAVQWLVGVFAVTAILAAVAVFMAKAAEESARIADISRRTSEASTYDAEASSHFAEARTYELRWETARQRKLEITRVLAGLPTDEDEPTRLRRQNLKHEASQLEQAMKELSARANGPRRLGYAQLNRADATWNALLNDGHRELVSPRKRPVPPYIFSIELLNAGRGESILIHYGTPDSTSLVMINGGSRQRYKTTVEPRLKELKAARYNGEPTPIELFVASDQDADKIEGLVRLLEDDAKVAAKADRVADIRLIWANVFSSSGLRGRLRALIDKTGIPLNEPFDRLVIRRDSAPAIITLPGGLEIIVLGPGRQALEELYDVARKQEGDPGTARGSPVPPIESLPDERFTKIPMRRDKTPLLSPRSTEKDSACRPSKNAELLGQVALRDRSVPNLASTVLLFRFRGKTFLHTGDSRADLIEAGLKSAGLMTSGRAHVDLLNLPHYASENNVTLEFLEHITADEYLFSGDGTHGNPEIATIAALIAARQCAQFVMNFVNRDGVVVDRREPASSSQSDRAVSKALAHGEKLDAFFAEEEQYRPNYRRIFRATDQGSVIIDLLDRLTY